MKGVTMKGGGLVIDQSGLVAQFGKGVLKHHQSSKLLHY
jgi:hypothetical protein